jgi:hypothetical protein
VVEDGHGGILGEVRGKGNQGIKMEDIIEAIKSALKKLKNNDGMLFECPIENSNNYDPRKLHEVCINHKLANYLEEYIFPIYYQHPKLLFTDIEFNREGLNIKELDYKGQEDRVRPDIIIHNRKTGDDKINILIVECKKEPVNNTDIETDIRKIKAFLTDSKYNYCFGLHVLYSKNKINGTFYFKEDGQVKTQKL